MSSVTYFNIIFVILVLMFGDIKTSESDGCDPIPASLTAKKTGQKAWDKCIEYKERYVYPCEESSVPGARPQRADHCKHDSLVQNDTVRGHNELSNIVFFAYDEYDNISLSTGGTIISERHVLAITSNVFSFFGQPHSVYLGAPVDKGLIDNSRLYKIKRIVLHPEYNDEPAGPYLFAIVEMEEPMKLNKYIKSVCLHTGEPLNYDEATYTSRYLLKNDSQASLTKLELTKLSDKECFDKFATEVKQSYIEEWLMCYQDKSYVKETFLEEMLTRKSGCPLQVESDEISCMNIIIGVSSFAMTREPSWTMFTRVSPYLAWIESVVWP